MVDVGVSAPVDCFSPTTYPWGLQMFTYMWLILAVDARKYNARTSGHTKLRFRAEVLGFRFRLREFRVKVHVGRRACRDLAQRAAALLKDRMAA